MRYRQAKKLLLSVKTPRVKIGQGVLWYGRPLWRGLAPAGWPPVGIQRRRWEAAHAIAQRQEAARVLGTHDARRWPDSLRGVVTRFAELRVLEGIEQESLHRSRPVVELTSVADLERRDADAAEVNPLAAEHLAKATRPVLRGFRKRRRLPHYERGRPDHGMLFTDALARSILQGRKVVTRRPITRQTCLPIAFWSSLVEAAGFGDLDWSAHTPDVDCSEQCETRDYCSIFADGSSTKGGQHLHVPALDHETRQRVYCRIKPGDRLWVREAWRVIPDCTSPGEALVVYRAGAPGRLCKLPEDVDAAELSKWSRLSKKGEPRWTPSLLMPLWAARTVREVVSVHAEQLGPLTDEQALEEGFATPAEFQNAWDAIYRAKEKTMASRPWVWVTRFAGPVE